jgi:hypothetical protein
VNADDLPVLERMLGRAVGSTVFVSKGDAEFEELDGIEELDDALELKTA